MAILQGFPPSNTISPSVRISEVDASFIAPEDATATVGIVGFASKGPINIPVRVATTRELHRTFGNPHPETGDPYMIYAAELILQVANSVTLVRVGDDEAVSDNAAATAVVSVPSAGGQVAIESDTAGPYTFTEDRFLRSRLNGVLSSRILVVMSGVFLTSELVDVLNDQMSFEDGMVFYVAAGDKLGLKSTFSFGPDVSIELVAVQDAMYGGTVTATNHVGMGVSMTQAITTGTATKFPADAYTASGTYDFTSLTGLNLQIIIDGTDNVNIDNVVQVVDLVDLEGAINTIADVVTEINDQITAGTIPGGFEADASGDSLVIKTLHHGRDAQSLVRSESTADLIFGLSNITAFGASPSGVSGAANPTHLFGITFGTTNSSGEITFVLNADSPGIEGNVTQVVVTNDIRDGIFTLEVFSSGNQVEAWGGLTKDETSRFYVETFLALVSDYILATDNTSTLSSPLDGTYDLAGGTDGIPADPDDQDDLLIGSDIAFTGLQALSDPEQVDIDLIAIPGHASTSVVLALIDVAQVKRQDSLAIIDPPFGLTVQEITDWQNGRHPLNTVRFDSDFGALYWPWVKIRDTFNRIDVWVAPSGPVLATIVRSDALSAPWFAPAGLTRGQVTSISDVFSRPSLAERDLMYGNRNAINPIIQFIDVEGFVIWGQKTLQRTPTALDRVNVRRMMIEVEKRIKNDARALLFEPNDTFSRSRFVDIATAVLEDVQLNRGLVDFVVQADEELNTPDVIDRNELRARIGIQPTRAIEFIFIEFVINRTGSFSETSAF